MLGFKKTLRIGRAAAGILLAAGLCGCTAPNHPPAAKIAEALYMADMPPVATIPAGGFPLSVPADRMVGESRIPVEEGTVRFFWNEQELVVEAQLQDSDILAKGKADQLQHNELGDVLEIFLQPPGKPYYWELFATPHEYQSSLFWNRTLSSKWDKTPAKRIHLDLQVVPFDGVRPGWAIHVRIPFRDLMRQGDPSPQDGGWRILAARQNFTGKVEKDCRELSSFPPLDITNFHATEHFVELHLKGKIKP